MILTIAENGLDSTLRRACDDRANDPQGGVIERDAAGTTGPKRLTLLRFTPSTRRPRLASASVVFLHPLWLSSLAVLVLNDHVLKGSGLLPGVVTGKLSDFAGLVVAPVLLAALLHALLPALVRVRTRAAFTAAHVAVGAVFSAIQIVPWFADAWSAAMAALGAPWAITMDPTDLLALPALVLSHRVFAPERAHRCAMAPRTVLELGAGGVGLMACVATSRVEPEPFRPEIFTDVYVHNSGDTDVVVRIRRLAESVDIDCALVAEDPGRLLSEPLFGPATSWTVPPGVNHGLWTNSEWDDVDDGRDCRVVLFDADDFAPAIVFWRAGDPPMHTVAGEELDPEDRGGIELAWDEDGAGHYVGGEGLVFAPVAEPPPADTCAPQLDGDRLDWSAPPPLGEHTVVAVDLGFDGCWGIDLSGSSWEGRWYVCAPIDALPFAEGDVVRVEPQLDSGAGDPAAATSVVVERLGTDELEGLGVTAALQLTRGASVPQIRGLRFAPVPDFECGFVVETTCGTVGRASSLTVGGAGWTSGTLRPGEPPVHLEHDDGSTADVWLTHAQDRIALDPECAQGPDTLGGDVEVVAVWTAAP